MKAFKLFKIKPEERIQSLVALTVIVLLNALFIYRMHDLFMQEGFGPYWKVFEHELHLSGYDPLTYLGVTDWDVVYQVFRHPLLSFIIWPLYLLNEGLTWLLGVNCVQYLVALPLIVCSFYSYIFLYRIHREVIALERWDATLLTAFYFSFAYILLSVIVPDHFTISMFLLLVTLYISGVCIQKGREFRWWQSARPLHDIDVSVARHTLHLGCLYSEGKGVPLVAVGHFLLYHGRRDTLQWYQSVPFWILRQSERFLPSEISAVGSGIARSLVMGNGNMGVSYVCPTQGEVTC